MKLLLIEDDRAAASYVQQGLAELGHACDHAETGLDGLTAAVFGAVGGGWCAARQSTHSSV